MNLIFNNSIKMIIQIVFSITFMWSEDAFSLLGY